MTNQDIKRIKLKIPCIDCGRYWTDTQLENNSHKCRKDIKEKKIKEITITCFDNQLKKWILPLDSHQISTSMPISEAFEKESEHPKEFQLRSGKRYQFYIKYNKPNSLPSQQIEEIVKRLKDQYALFVRRDTHGVEEELYPVDIAKVLKQELEAVAESVRKEAVEELDLLKLGRILVALSQPKECDCHCHLGCKTDISCKHCQPKGEDK